MSIDSYRRTAQRKLEELNALKKERSRIRKEAADALNKASKAVITAGKTKSSTVYKSKMHDVDRYNEKNSKTQEKLSRVEEKIAKKEEEYKNAFAKLAKEQKRQDDIRQKEEEKRKKEQERVLCNMNKAISKQGERQVVLEDEVEQLKMVPSTITILFLATNPKDTDKLRLDEEARNIREMITKAKHRDSVDLKTRWAVRYKDLLQNINETNPTIIHFAGHGGENGELALEDDDGNTKMISPEVMLQTIATTGKDTVRLVYFDACQSAKQAEKVVGVLDGAIGMAGGILD